MTFLWIYLGLSALSLLAVTLIDKKLPSEPAAYIWFTLLFPVPWLLIILLWIGLKKGGSLL